MTWGGATLFDILIIKSNLHDFDRFLKNACCLHGKLQESEGIEIQTAKISILNVVKTLVKWRKGCF